MSNPRKTTSAKSWKKRTGGVDLDLPSGNVCRVVRPGMDKIMSAGILPDSLTPIALENLEKAESGGRPKRKGEQEAKEKAMLAEMFSDQSAMAEVFKSFDKVTAMCVKEPAVRVHWWTEEDELKGHLPEDANINDEIDEEFRDEDLLYTDDVDQMDKVFIFQFVLGGSSDLERFRQEHGDELAALESQ